MIRLPLERLPVRALILVVAASDVTIAAAAVPLEPFSLRSAADPQSSALLILGLLAANIALLGVVFVGLGATSLLLRRVVLRCWRG